MTDWLIFSDFTAALSNVSVHMLLMPQLQIYYMGEGEIPLKSKGSNILISGPIQQRCPVYTDCPSGVPHLYPMEWNPLYIKNQWVGVFCLYWLRDHEGLHWWADMHVHLCVFYPIKLWAAGTGIECGWASYTSAQVPQLYLCHVTSRGALKAGVETGSPIDSRKTSDCAINVVNFSTWSLQDSITNPCILTVF